MAKLTKNERKLYAGIDLDDLHRTAAFAGIPLDLPTSAEIRAWKPPRTIRQPDGERRYTVPELAAEWHMSENRVRSLFAHEQGVVEIAGPRRTRRWIPLSVALRVHKRLCSDGFQTARASSGPPRIVRKRHSRTSMV